ncbi:sialidase family protein [Schlesneria sp.]|uniref:sialidase family protein n=1 Tax=Schlesneria sp. TaxID=2762018 RepID=UPI002EF3620D
MARQHRRLIGGLFLFVILASIWLSLSRDEFVPALTETLPYPVVLQSVSPELVSSRQLSPGPGFQSPKPVIAADRSGTVVVLAYGLVNDPLAGDILAWRSIDRGEMWGLPENLTARSTAGELRFDPWVETDRRGHYYAVYGLRSDGQTLFRRSANGGASWSHEMPIRWRHGDRPVLAVSPNGRRIVIAASMSEPVPDAATRPLDGNAPNVHELLRARIRHYSGVFLSNNFGKSWQRLPPPFGETTQAIPFSVVIDDDRQIAASWIVEGEGSTSQLSMTDNDGETWRNTVLVESLQPDRPHPFNGERFPVVARDGSGRFHTAFITARAEKLLTRSSSDGREWSDATQHSHPSAEEVRMAAIDAIGPMVHVMWMERQGETWQAYYRGSSDHGKTWIDSICLSNSIQLKNGTIVDGFQIYGDDDQSSLRDDGRGRVHAVWSVQGGIVIHSVIDWRTESPTGASLTN